MPAIRSLPILHSLLARAANAPSANTGFQVICAWPISGNYGTGSRLLYYVLIIACVIARKTEWLRKACLAAALLFPAIAALHAIVLAAVHRPGAVDLDIFGAFQMCSIGILAGPVTVRLSRTYFFDPGRNIIFIWTGLILAGLLSLTVEFWRIDTSNCSTNRDKTPLIPGKTPFPYDDGDMCGIVCNVDDGPFSPMRKGAVNNIYIIPAPRVMTFGTATLIAAACCIPAILSLASMWNKIAEINYKRRWGKQQTVNHAQEIEGTNGATIGGMNRVNYAIRFFLNIAEIPVFGGAVLAILIMGEINLWSKELTWQTEPIASIGQWAPIVGSGLAALGSLYMILARGEVEPKPKVVHCDCAHHHKEGEAGYFYPQPGQAPGSPNGVLGQASPQESKSSAPSGSPKHRGRQNEKAEIVHHRVHESPDLEAVERPGRAHTRAMTEVTTEDRQPSPGPGGQLKRALTAGDVGGRLRVQRTFTKIGEYLGTPGYDWGEVSFQRGKARDFPTIPGEEYRNKELVRIEVTYNPLTEVPKTRSRVGSTNSRTPSMLDLDASSTRAPSPGPQRTRSPSPFPRTDTLGGTSQRISFDDAGGTPPPLGPLEGKRPERRQTLEVPPAIYGSLRNHAPASPVSPTTPTGPASPTTPTTPTIIMPTDTDPPLAASPDADAQSFKLTVSQ